jgi:hypothetical protein
MAMSHTPLALVLVATWAASSPAAAAESREPVRLAAAERARDCLDWIGRAQREPRPPAKPDDCAPR